MLTAWECVAPFPSAQAGRVGRGARGSAPPCRCPPSQAIVPATLHRGHQGRTRSIPLARVAARAGLGGQSFPTSVHPRRPVQRGRHPPGAPPASHLSPGSPWAEAGPWSPALGPALGPLCLRAGPPHWLRRCLHGGRHSASQPRECAHRKRSAGHSARRKSQLNVGFCSFTDFGHKLPVYSIFNQSKSPLFSHKLRKAEMLTVTVGTAGGLLLCGGDGGPAAAPGGTMLKPCGSWGSTWQELDAPPGGTSCPGARTFLGDTGMVFAAEPLGLWPLLPCELRCLTRWLGASTFDPHCAWRWF